MKLWSKTMISIAITIILLLLIFGLKEPNPDGDPVSIYHNNYKSLSFATTIETTDKTGEPVTIKGKLATIITDPLTMRDANGNIIAYAGDDYNFISQDDHRIESGDIYYDMIGKYTLFGNSYDIRDMNGRTVATLDVNSFDTNGCMYNMEGDLIAQYTSSSIRNDYTVYVYEKNRIDENIIQMIFASYVSDVKADQSANNTRKD